MRSLSEHKKDFVCVVVKSSDCGKKEGQFYDGWEPSSTSTSEDEEVTCCRDDPPHDILWLYGSPEECIDHGFRYFNSSTLREKKCATVDWPYATCFMASPEYCDKGHNLPVHHTEKRTGDHKLLSFSYFGVG